ncbi:MAG TPA: hypothetical protein VFB81_04640 [Myxococcales bacterium]|nr:hypothetical protein [Myxococcales bacterium]
MSSRLVTAASLKEFFKQLLTEVLSERRVQVAEITEFYLVNLLSDFTSAEKLFTTQVDGRKEHEPLAVLYHQALQADREGRIKAFRRLGDLSLYKAGFFADALRGGAVGPDYYIQMGGNAYGQVADLSPQTSFAGAFRELCQKFRAVVAVLEQIAARGLAATGPLGALKVYESWVRTGNDRLEKVLVDAGLVPVKGGLVN